MLQQCDAVCCSSMLQQHVAVCCSTIVADAFDAMLLIPGVGGRRRALGHGEGGAGELSGAYNTGKAFLMHKSEEDEAKEKEEEEVEEGTWRGGSWRVIEEDYEMVSSPLFADESDLSHGNQQQHVTETQYSRNVSLSTLARSRNKKDDWVGRSGKGARCCGVEVGGDVEIHRQGEELSEREREQGRDRDTMPFLTSQVCVERDR